MAALEFLTQRDEKFAAEFVARSNGEPVEFDIPALTKLMTEFGTTLGNGNASQHQFRQLTKATLTKALLMLGDDSLVAEYGFTL
ncbi:hypothetical protein [Qipengyuania gelatinilytica]|uniref:Uncharacterized protein n=1 Tax=Qipengyuania gelatinilytica TaxID=2867231 RepID=A0ABX9A4N1_9SPHN|nr:hypothetical protein [Qipengyuania gelatinilytica]QZD96227.1 hypothetical protein K3136_05925 [Qipengyuania gelatinilytica]